MWSAILFNCILSIIIIIIAHQIWEYCKINYTSQKTKNLVEIQASKYKQIVEDMERNSSALVSVDKPVPTKLPNDFLPLDEKEKEWVQNELVSFIDTL
jgi:hypothetical protein